MIASRRLLSGTTFLAAFSLASGLRATPAIQRAFAGRAMAAAASSEAASSRPANPLGAVWQQTMLRIRDPETSVPFYENHFGLSVVDKYDFPQWSFSLYFMTTLTDEEKASWPEPGTEEAHARLWTTDKMCLELTHNHGTTLESPAPQTGNQAGFRGFGHIAFNTEDVYAACAELEAAGARFQKKPDEGRMKGLAFVLDPDGYWIEIVRRAPGLGFPKYNLSQTMLRVNSAVDTLRFYRDLLGMSVLAERHFDAAHGDFSLYFLQHLPEGETPPDPTTPEAMEYIKTRFGPVLELTVNNSPEDYVTGNEANDAGAAGFGHVGFLVDDLEAAFKYLDERGVTWKKRPQDGNMRQIAFAYDPTGYWVELVQKGASF